MFKKSFLKSIAEKETVSLKFLEKQLDNARAVIPLNKNRKIPNPCVIGDGFKVKINTNLGLSSKGGSIEGEIKKMLIAAQYGADTVMDLSVSKNLATLRKQILKKCPIPLGTVPIYEAALELEKRKSGFEKLTFDDYFSVLES